MANEMVAQQAEESGLDRRALLIKAAAVGAVAWTAPLIVSSPALASSCTPECAIQNIGTPRFVGTDVCQSAFTGLAAYRPPSAGEPLGSPLYQFIDNSNKMSVLSILGPANLVCPCGAGGAPNTIIGNIPTTIPKVGSASQFNSGACVSGSTSFFIDTFSLAGTGYVDPNGTPGVTAANSFLGGKSGAIGNGTFRIPSLCVSVGCPDATGDIVYHKCNFIVCFNYFPSGNCGTLVPVQSNFTPVANSCTIGCNHC